MNKINFSYASKSEHNFAQRLIIKTIETLSGKKKLENLYKKNPENQDLSDIHVYMKMKDLNFKIID